MAIALIEKLQSSYIRRTQPKPWLTIRNSSWRVAGCGLHGAAGGGGVAEAGADPGGEACPQLHDGHAAHQAGEWGVSSSWWTQRVGCDTAELSCETWVWMKRKIMKGRKIDMDNGHGQDHTALQECHYSRGISCSAAIWVKQCHNDEDWVMLDVCQQQCGRWEGWAAGLVSSLIINFYGSRSRANIAK